MTLQDQIQTAATKFVHKYLNAHNMDRLDDPPLHRFDLKGKCAGQYRWKRSRGKVTFEYRWNMAAAEKYTDDYLKNTVGHEVAHYIAHKIHGTNCGHDYRWKRVMRDLGLEPTRCHSYKLAPARKVKKYHWECPECHFKHTITQRLITNMKRSKGYRSCGICRTRLDPKDIKQAA